jgi:glycosyltransferase involved in cell wall biosynthesis
MTYYTYGLVGALSIRCQVSTILMRQLLPTRLYPGHARVGNKGLTDLSFPPGVSVLDGVDWFWVPSIFRAVRFLRARRPGVVVFQWWSGTVLHSYLVLAAVARACGAKVIVEFHEVQDTGESNHPWASFYVRTLVPLLLRMASSFVAHSEFERQLLSRAYGIPPERLSVIPNSLSVITHVADDREEKPSAGRPQHRHQDDECRLLYFGLIRPYKGVEDLLDAFALIPASEIRRYRLTVVGETWEGWSLPAEKIADHPYRDRIHFLNRYVTDAEVSALFSDADIVVLPYRRSSQSGPLHLAMGRGLPVVTTRVDGLSEAVGEYGGSVLVDSADPSALLAGIRRAEGMQGRRFAPSVGLSETADAYCALFSGGVEGRSSGL